jgi:ubiquinone/menaquinone biosynthesis C-methylase UbiE
MALARLMGAQVRKPSGLLGRLLGHIMARGHRPLTDWTLSLMDIQPTDRVLDIGCGSGMAMHLIAGITVHGFVTGVDYSTVMVRQASQRNASDVQSGQEAVVHGNVSALPLGDHFFDKACAIETFYFWHDPLACLKEVRRVLKPGGLVAIAMEMSKEEDGARHKAAAIAVAYRFMIYSHAEMEHLLLRAGFSRVRCVIDQEQGNGWLCALGFN